MKVKYHFFVVFFEFYKFFVSFSKCESILDRAATQVPTKKCLEVQINEDTYHKENQCLRTNIKARTWCVTVAIITKFAIRYTIHTLDTTKCLHEKFVHWDETIRSEYWSLVLDWRLLLVC